MALGILNTALKYRFLKKMLGTKYRFSFVWFYLGSLLYGQANVVFGIAGTVRGNLIYLCACSLVLKMLLFHGSIVKKCFFTLWMYCASGIVFCTVFPLFHGLAVTNGLEGSPVEMINAADMISRLVEYLMMEILQRRLHLLKRDFADQDAFYLMYIILFIYAAQSMLLELFTGISDWQEGAVLPTALCCSLIGASGVGLHLFCVMMLEQRLLKRLAGQQYELLGRHLEASREQYDQLVKMRHDMKNHDLCLKQLLSEGKTEEAIHYLAQMDERMEQGQDAVQTGSVYVDALLTPKYHQARQLGIDISIRMSVPDEEKIAAVDICCILANGLDNAIEACGRAIQAGEPAGWIRMRSQTRTNYWVLEIRNSLPASAAAGHTFSDIKNLFMRNTADSEGRNGYGNIFSIKRFHFTGQQVPGIGLQNIRTAVERYEGVLEIQSGEEFSLNIMLPMPLAAKKNPSASS